MRRARKVHASERTSAANTRTRPGASLTNTPVHCRTTSGNNDSQLQRSSHGRGVLKEALVKKRLRNGGIRRTRVRGLGVLGRALVVRRNCTRVPGTGRKKKFKPHGRATVSARHMRAESHGCAGRVAWVLWHRHGRVLRHDFRALRPLCGGASRAPERCHTRLEALLVSRWHARLCCHNRRAHAGESGGVVAEARAVVPSTALAVPRSLSSPRKSQLPLGGRNSNLHRRR